MSWTEERVALLKQLWGEGKTAAEIAKALGDGVTRNAVIGKAHRLKLSSRLSPIQQNAKPVSKSTSPDAPKIKKAVIRQPEFKGNKIKMVDLEPRMCRWPNGDPRDADFSFCGCENVPGLPYCETHVRAAYQVVTRNKSLKASDFASEAGSPQEFDIKSVSNA